MLKRKRTAKQSINTAPKDKWYTKFNTTKWLIALIIIVTTFAVYIPALPNQFVWDDDRIAQNSYLTDFSNVQALVQPNRYNDVSAEPSYRPFVVLTRFIDIALWGNWPTGHRLQNIFTHILTALLLFWFCFKLFKNEWVAGFVSLLFALHPIHTEPVAGIAFRADIQAGMFMLLALVCFWHFKQKHHPIIMYVLLLITSLLAMLSKETAVVLPFLILIIDLFCTNFSDEKFKVSLQKFWFYGGLLVITIIYFLLRFKIFLPAQEIYVDPSAHGTLLEHLETSSRLFFFYLYKFFWPLQQVPLADFHRSIGMTWDGLLAILGVLVFVFIWFYSFRRNKLVFFGLTWFTVSILPTLQIISTNALFADRWLYIPSMGIIIAVGGLLLPWVNNKNLKNQRVFLAFFLIILCLLGIKTGIRCLDWKDDLSLWQAAVTAEPYNIDALISLANTEIDNGHYKLAFSLFSRAQKIDSKDPRVLAGLATVYCFFEDYQKSISFGEKALKSTKNTKAIENVYEYLTKDYLKTNQIKLAIKYGEISIRIRPNVMLRYNLGRAYETDKQYFNALIQYLTVIKLTDQKFPNYYIDAARMYSQLNHAADAIPLMEEAFALFPDNQDVRQELISIYKQTGHNDLAQRLTK